MEVKIFLTIAAALFIVMSEEAENGRSTDKTCSETVWPLGDPKRCKELMRLDKLGVRSDLGVMPGSGWDNLLNEERGLVFKYVYKECKTTDDGQMLVPDNVFTAPVKLSTQEVYSETFKSWTETTSTTSSSINEAKSASIDEVASVTSSFSKEKSEVKTHMVEKNTVAVRAQYRVIRYNVFMKPDSAFSREFENRLRAIAAHVELQRMDVAVYESQRLVRDFGSHVIMKVVAGAAIVRTDYIEKNFDLDSTLTMDELSLAQEAELDTENATGKGSVKVSFKENKDKMNSYKKHLSYSTTISLGGNQNLMTQLSELNISQWLLGVDKNLVALDRDGEFLYTFITPKALPTIPAVVVSIVSKLVKEATEAYYKKNTKYGCTNMDSYGFDPSANADKGTCFDDVWPPNVAGIYERADTCKIDCKKDAIFLDQCPEGFESLDLWTFKKDVQECGECIYKIYWCAATSRAKYNGTWLFGGIYTDKDDNPVTKNQSCPMTFHETKILDNKVKICTSNNFERSKRFAVPFGGFYTCNFDNPFAGRKSINNCPPLYMSKPIHVNGTECEVSFCMKPKYVSKEMALVRPPFESRPINYVLNYKWTVLDSEVFKVRHPIHHVAGYCILTGVGCIGIIHIASIVISHVRYRIRAKKKLRELESGSRTSENSV